MTKSEDKDSVFRWLRRPLCCRYIAVVFRTVSIPVDVPAHLRQTYVWGLARLASGDFEVLGVWKLDGSVLDVPHRVFTDLCERGVDSFKVLAGCPAVEAASGTLRDFLSAGECASWVIPSEGSSLRQSRTVLSLRPATRRALFAADDLANGIDQRLNAAMARRGPFREDEDAMVFVAEFLARAERRVYEPRARRRSASPGESGRAPAAAPA